MKNLILTRFLLHWPDLASNSIHDEGNNRSHQPTQAVDISGSFWYMLIASRFCQSSEIGCNATAERQESSQINAMEEAVHIWMSVQGRKVNMTISKNPKVGHHDASERAEEERIPAQKRGE